MVQNTAMRGPETPITQPPPPASSAARRYDLDALRGFAMLLGIVLHAAIPFVPYWEEGDPGSNLLWTVFEFIHGFRMPLFFILSGFFTTMLWRRRGLRALLRHRLRRVGLPLLIGVFVVLPLVVAGIIGGYVISGVDVEGDAGAVYDDDLGASADAEFASADIGDPSDANADKPAAPFGFAHLWFLWFLLWMVAGFVTVTAIVGWLTRRISKDRPTRSGLTRIALLAMPAIAVVAARAMSDETFGPDTSDAFIPNGAVFGFYAAFFAFGALAYDRETTSGVPLIDAVGRLWPLQLGVAALVLFPLGRGLVTDYWTVSTVLQVGFAWLMSFGLLGAFRRYMASRSFRVRWLSDASYWMYLMHLPLVFVAQGVAARLELPALVGFVFICLTITPLLLASYGYVIRYSFVGRLLNGARTRAGDEQLRSQPASS